MKQEELMRLKYLRGLATGEIQGPPVGYASIDRPWLKYYDEDIANINVPDNINIYDYMEFQNKENIDRIAINYFGRKITYGEMFEQIEVLTRKFSSLGVI